MDDKTLEYMKLRVVKAEAIKEQIKLLKQRINHLRIANKAEIWIQCPGNHMQIHSDSVGIYPADVLKWIKQPLIDIFEARISELEEEFAKL